MSPETFQCQSPVALDSFSILQVPVGKLFVSGWYPSVYPAAYHVGTPNGTALFVQYFPSLASSSQKPFSRGSYQKAIGTSLSRRSFESSPSIPIPASTIPRKVTPPERMPSSLKLLWAIVGVQTNGTLTDCPAARVMLNVHSCMMTPMGCHISSLASAVTGDGSTPICWKVTFTWMVSPLVMYSRVVESGWSQTFGDTVELPTSIPVTSKSTGLFLGPISDFIEGSCGTSIATWEMLTARSMKESRSARTELIVIKLRK